MPTCLELAGAAAPPGLDGPSFAPQLLGKRGKTREWVHVLYVEKVDKQDKSDKAKVKTVYFVRDAKWKLRENGELYDVSSSPYAETLVEPDHDTAESRTARQRLQAVLRKLHDEGADKRPAASRG